jgi:hypothetical protein
VPLPSADSPPDPVTNNGVASVAQAHQTQNDLLVKKWVSATLTKLLASYHLPLSLRFDLKPAYVGLILSELGKLRRKKRISLLMGREDL